MNRAFTLIELIVVIVIIALLTTFGMASYNRVQNNSKTTKVLGELHEINNGLVRLTANTRQIPNHYIEGTCVQNNETYLNSCAAGLLCTDGNFPNWQGPYTELNLKDPWDHYYYFDPDYSCKTNIKGCENVPNNKVVRAILSGGPDGNFGYTSIDNIVLVLCQ
jgi:prepilin-type N-terminal cleavage/methylation domain-containing protein